MLKGYCQGTLDRSVIEETLGISKTRFFALLKRYRVDAKNFVPACHRQTATRIPARVEEEIERKLMLEKSLIDDSTLPITRYNYAAIRDHLIKHDIKVSAPTIIVRAKKEPGPTGSPLSPANHVVDMSTWLVIHSDNTKLKRK